MFVNNAVVGREEKTDPQQNAKMGKSDVEAANDGKMKKNSGNIQTARMVFIRIAEPVSASIMLHTNKNVGIKGDLK